MAKKHALLSAIFSLAFFSYGVAQTDSTPKTANLPGGLIFSPYAYGHIEFGSIMKGSLNGFTSTNVGSTDGQIHNGWVEDQIAVVGIKANYNKRLSMRLGLLTQLYFSYPVVNKDASRMTKTSTQAVGIDDAYAQYHWGDSAAPSFLWQAGFFKYKYNPDARNLGEYLFRTGTYPIYFTMAFDFPQARLFGFRFATAMDGYCPALRGLTIESILASATLPPTMVWSGALIASYTTPHKLLSLGAGIDYSSLYNVYNENTYPGAFGNNGRGDPVTPLKGNAYFVNDAGDSVFYTFAGTKIMGRLSIDPKVLFPTRSLGENDCKFYIEGDIIGVKAYSDSGYESLNADEQTLVAPSYNKWWEKMPIAVGFNLPTWKKLDLLNIEAEYFGAKYFNDVSDLTFNSSKPVPHDWTNKTKDSPQYSKSKIKWSVYAKKTFCDGHLGVVGQVANDHLTLSSASYDFQDAAEVLVTSKDLWWALKLSWMF
jgi:hypothetical protein